MSRALLVIGFWLGSACVHRASGQNLPIQTNPAESWVETISPYQDNPGPTAELQEDASPFSLSQPDLNRVSVEDLLRLPFLAPTEATAIVEHRRRIGDFLEVEELNAVKGLSTESAIELARLVRAGKSPLLPSQRELAENRSQFLLLRWGRTLQAAKGYKPQPTDNGDRKAAYEGSPDRLLMRYRLAQPGRYSFGISTEKDPGEKLVWNPGQRRYGADYVSAHAMVRSKGGWQALLGDYQLQLGQGLVYGAGLSFAKGGEPVAGVYRGSTGVKPYTSLIEGGQLRGGAFGRVGKKAEFMAFASYKRLDAGFAQAIDTSQSAERLVSSLQLTGLHRTQSELAKRERLTELQGGAYGQARLAQGRGQFGALLSGTRYSMAVQPSDQPYRSFDFRGREVAHGSLWFRANLGPGLLFGEGAASVWGNKAVENQVSAITGWAAAIGPQTEFAVVARRYGKSYYAFHGNAFGENTRNVAEEGLYLGILHKPTLKWQVGAWYDLFRQTWLGYLRSQPGMGQEALGRLTYLIDKKNRLSILARYQQKLRDKRLPEQPEVMALPASKWQITALADLQSAERIQWKTRLYYVRYSHAGRLSEGYGLAQDVWWAGRRLSLGGRYAIFSTDDFDSRFYVPERSVTWNYQVPAYYGQGSRWYLLARVRAGSRFDFEGRISETYYPFNKTVGSGTEQKAGPRDTDVIVQMRFYPGR